MRALFTATSGWLDTSLVEPIVEMIGETAATLVPIGIGIMAVFVGIKMIPKIIYKFM